MPGLQKILPSRHRELAVVNCVTRLALLHDPGVFQEFKLKPVKSCSRLQRTSVSCSSTASPSDPAGEGAEPRLRFAGESFNGCDLACFFADENTDLLTADLPLIQATHIFVVDTQITSVSFGIPQVRSMTRRSHSDHCLVAHRTVLIRSRMRCTHTLP